jgi:acetyltransferase-like isoleucine patch superfamily enzyme
VIRATVDLFGRHGPITTVVLAVENVRKRLRRRRLNARRNTTIHPTAEVNAGVKCGTDGPIVVGPECFVGSGVVFDPSGGAIVLERNALVNVNSVVLGHGGVEVGEDALLGPGTTIVAANHTFDDRDRPIESQPVAASGVEVGRDVWIGANATVLDGVTVGEGAVVGAGSVVTDSVPPYTVVAGNPAEKISKR